MATTSASQPSTADKAPIDDAPSGPVKVPFAHPTPESKPAPADPLTADQQTKYDELLKTVKSWETLPKTSTKNAETAPLSEDEQFWLTRECLLRYLRATKWNLAQSTKRLQDSLVWRREYGTNTFTADYISEENATGKQVIFGYDKEGRPCLYLLPNKQNTKNSPKQVEHLVFMLERTLTIAPAGQETLALLVDFRNSSAGSNPSAGTGKQVLNILQNHYPERLGRALITHLPWYVTAFLKIISPFIDPVTKTKMKYNEPLTDHIPAEQLMSNAGGSAHFEYDHSIYWPALNKLADERRAEQKERWLKAGKHIGESEIYLKGGEASPINGTVEEKVNGEANGTAIPSTEAPTEQLAKLDVKDDGTKADGEDTKTGEDETKVPATAPSKPDIDELAETLVKEEAEKGLSAPA